MLHTTHRIPDRVTPVAPRRTPRAAASVLAALTALALTAAAPGGAPLPQAPSFAGTWDVTWDQAIRTVGDRVIDVQRRGTAILVLEQHGDSVAGSWTVPSADTEILVVGTARGDTLTLWAPDAVLEDRGRGLPVRMRWRGVVEGGEIRGVMFIEFRPGDRPLRSWEAVRRQG